tara:strand:+ start:455 stop:856 length:402 start_codon:yes stop_codon:yes gene_type:complete
VSTGSLTTRSKKSAADLKGYKSLTKSVVWGEILSVGGDNDLINRVDGVIQGFGTLEISAVNTNFDNSSIILPGGTLATGTLTLDLGASSFDDSSVIDIELAGAGDFDILNFIGTGPTLGGTLVISTISFTPTD